MFYVTGDIHGGIDIAKLSGKNFPEGKALSRKDYIIICGDFGLPFLPTDTLPMEKQISTPWRRSGRKEYRYWISWLSERPYTVLWVDGNHDNHCYWNGQQSVEWNGGRAHIHPDAENVIHLMRGEYYEIDGNTFWAMGGAASHDRFCRKEGENWWPEEIPDDSQMQHGTDTLAAHGWKTDYILTHTLPQKLVHPLGLRLDPPEPTREYFDYIHENTDFRCWFCGHYHIDLDCPEYRMRILYRDLAGPF